ncbi:MAG TPA: MFS transporter [Stellaceae bacterium]|jgi:putative MFS transporter
MAEIAQAAPAQSVAAIVGRIERMPYTRFHFKARTICAIATFFDGYDFLAISYALPVLVSAWHLTPPQVGLLIASSNISSLFGGLGFAWLGDGIGRLKTMAIATALFGVASFACAFAWDFDSLLACRALEGLGLGGLGPAAAAYLTEMARAEGRGRFFLLFQGIFIFGLACAAFLSPWMVPNFGWQSMFYLGAVPAPLAICFVLLLPESARWYADKGRFAEADRVVRLIEDSARRDGRELPPPAVVPWSEGRERPHWTEIFRGIYAARTVIVWLLFFCIYFVSNALISWLPTLYRTVYHLDVKTALQYSAYTTIAGMIGVIVVALLVDHTGRRKWFTTCFIGIAVVFLYLWIRGAPTATVVLVAVTVGDVLMASISSLIFLYSAEIYPTRLRSRGVAIAGSWQKVGIVAGQISIGFIIQSFGIGGVFLQFAIASAAGAVIAALFAIEARNRALEEVSP